MPTETIVKKQQPNNPSMHLRGFTLIELMAVLAAVAAMLAFVIPSLTIVSKTYKLKALAREIEGQLQNGRMTAIDRNKAASLVFSSDNCWYYLDGNGTADSGESTYWAPAGGYSLNVSAPRRASPARCWDQHRVLRHCQIAG
jgi:prepilin-type N-terminal cleavage/methylation domain-containing protein